MELLVLGGTRFLGRHLVEAARARGHAVTLFHRGRSGADLFPDVPRVLGDRDRPEDLRALGGVEHDAVVDMCGFHPRQIRSVLDALGGRIRRYTFVSTISVYADFTAPTIDEDSPCFAPEDAALGEEASYGGAKVGCEQALSEALGERLLVVRPGLCTGPFDPTGRIPYWPRRVAAGGPVLAPGAPARPTQYTDARDLAAFLLDALEADAGGVFNVLSPPGAITMGAWLEACAEAVGVEPDFTWVRDGPLQDAGLGPFSGPLPLWIPEDLPGLANVSCARAQARGYRARSPLETARDVWGWLQVAEPIEGGLAPGLEAELLAARAPC